MQVVIWVLVAIAAVVIGRQAGQWLFTGKKKVTGLKRSAQTLAIALRSQGLTRLPAALEEFVIGDVDDLLVSIKDFATIVGAGNESIIKELEATYDRVLGEKLKTPEGRAVVAAKLAEAVKLAAEIAVVVK